MQKKIKRKKDEVEIRNKADQLVFTTEKNPEGLRGQSGKSGCR